MFFIPNALIGAFFRRWWGGWESTSIHIIKVVVGYLLAFCASFLATGDLIAAAGFSAIIGTSFLNPFHSYGMGMGMDGSGKSTLACMAVMGASYGVFSAAAAAWLVYWMADMDFAIYGAVGFFSPVPYLISWLVFNCWFKTGLGQYRKFFETSPGVWFIDYPTAVGELALGALLLGI